MQATALTRPLGVGSESRGDAGRYGDFVRDDGDSEGHAANVLLAHGVKGEYVASAWQPWVRLDSNRQGPNVQADFLVRIVARRLIA